MKVWGFLPVVERSTAERFGYARGPVIWMPEYLEGADREIMRGHEIHHVKQFYALAGAILLAAVLLFLFGPLWAGASTVAVTSFAIWYANDAGTYSRETAAYGVSARLHSELKGGSLSDAAEIYAVLFDEADDLYRESATVAEIKARILRRAKDGGLF